MTRNSDGRRELAVLESNGCDFLVEDGSGVALIDLRHVSAHLQPDEQAELKAPRLDLRAEVSRLRPLDLSDDGSPLKRLLRRYRRTFFAGPFTFREAVVVSGDEVAVSGFGTRDPVRPTSGEHGYRELPTRLTLRGTEAQTLFITEGRSLAGVAHARHAPSGEAHIDVSGFGSFNATEAELERLMNE